jgi:subfamily B ATP-binding cassette protein MsbA
MKIYLRILKFAKPYKIFIFISILTSIFYVVTNGLSLWIIGSLLSSVMSDTAIIDNAIAPISFTDKVNQFLFSYINSNDKIELLKFLSYSLIVSFFFKNLFFYFNNISLSYAQNGIIMDIRNSIFNKYQNLSLRFFKQKKSSELTSIIIHDVGILKNTFHQTVQNLFNQPLNVLFFFITLLLINAYLTLICFIIIPISGYITVKLSSSIRRKAMRSSKQTSALMNIVIENINNVKIVKAFTNQKNQIYKFVEQNLNLFNKEFKLESLKFLNTPILDMIGALIGAVLLWVGGKLVLVDGHLSADGFIKFFTFLFAMFTPAKKIANVSVEINRGIASADRVFNILDDSEIEIYNDPIKTEIDRFNQLEFKDVSFSYNGVDTVLNNINVTINKGDFIALVGESGSGKTTFSDLILNFYDINNGSITIDNINLKDININSLRNRIGLVSQDDILFNDTIYNNIKIGNIDATEEQIFEAAKKSNAYEFINKMPGKFQASIGEKGVKISGGQKQRLAIARAIIKKPDLLILDEATSALDSKSESKIQSSIDSVSEDTTLMVIAHRLSTIKKADQILLFDNGEIIEKGTHEELLALNKKYKKLYDLQFGVKNE